MSVKWKIPLFDLNYDIEEKKGIVEVIEGKWLSSGGKNL